MKQPKFKRAYFREKKTSYAMCGGKKKYKSSEASKKAHRWKQRKYNCPICNQWHLTTKGVK